MGNIVVSAQKQIDMANARAGLISVDNTDLMEYTAQTDFRMCLMELGLEEGDLA